jgi:hypothetical protein
MRKFSVLLVVLALVFPTGAMTAVYGGPGPASNSGDGVSDGSGFEDPLPGPIGDGDPLGPAPDAGDGVPDGSGLGAPNGSNQRRYPLLMARSSKSSGVSPGVALCTPSR